MRWTTDLGEIAFLNSDIGFEMHREKCPHHQCWLLLKGEWKESDTKGRHTVRAGEFRAYRPRERNFRIAEATTIQIGFRIFKEESLDFEWPAQRLLWQSASSLLEGRMDALGFDETIAQFRPSLIAEGHIPTWLKRARDFLHATYSEETSLTTIAEQVGISPNHLSASFSRAYGVSMSNYRKRLCLASTLKDRSYSRWNPIEHGFYDSSHFHRICRQELGLTPRQIARILQQS